MKYCTNPYAFVRAFTLIELLTVIAIIGILAAIIIPVTGKVRESARAVQCTSNQRQIAAALLLNASENKNMLLAVSAPSWPPGTNGVNAWFYELWPYVGYPAEARSKANQFSALPKFNNKNVFICPSVSAQQSSTLCYKAGQTPNGNLYSYGINSLNNPVAQNNSLLREPTPLNNVANPSRTVMICESSFVAGTEYHYLNTEYGMLPHGRAANFAYFDGHVARFSRANIPSYTGDYEARVFWWGK